MSRPLAGPSPLGGPSPRPGPSPRTGPSPLGGPSPRPINGPSPRTAPSPVASSGAAAVAQRNLSTPTRPSPASLAGPSPQGSSPSALKRGASSADKQRDPKKPKLAPGPSWIVDKVEVMQQQYKGALIAATMILQYQADSRAIGYKSKVPRTLEMRLETAWRNYDAVRRQVEWFIAQNVEYAAAPEKFMKARPPPLPLAPMTLPTPSPSIPAHMQGNTPKAAAAASPIQLGAASLLSNQPAATNAPGGFPEGLLDGSLDLSSMGMDELNAIIGGAQNANGGSDMNMPPQIPGPVGNVAANTEEQPDQNAMTPNTSNLLNTLQGTTTDSAQNPQPDSQAQQPQPPPPGDFDFNFGENGDVDLSNIDLSAFDELFGDDPTGSGAMGALGNDANASAAPPQEEKKDEQQQDATGAPTTELPTQGADQNQTQPAEQPTQPAAPPSASPQKPATPAQPAQQATPQALAQPPAESAPPQQSAETAPAEPVPAAEPAPAPAAEPAPVSVPEPEPQPEDLNNGLGDFGLGNDLGGDMGDINFDDFNFGEMPNVDGSEFASLFAEFK